MSLTKRQNTLSRIRKSGILPLIVLLCFVHLLIPLTLAESDFELDIQSPAEHQTMSATDVIRVITGAVVDSIEVYLNETPIGNVTSAGSEFELFLNTKDFVDGTYTLNVHAHKSADTKIMHRTVKIVNAVFPEYAGKSDRGTGLLLRIGVSLSIILLMTLVLVRFTRKKKGMGESKLVRLKRGQKDTKSTVVDIPSAVSEEIEGILQETEEGGYSNQKFAKPVITSVGAETIIIESDDPMEVQEMPEDSEDETPPQTNPDHLSQIISAYTPVDEDRTDVFVNASIDDISTASLIGLEAYVVEMRQNRISDQQIRNALIEQGWPEHILDKVIN